MSLSQEVECHEGYRQNHLAHLADAEAECAAVRAESDRHCEAIRAENEKRAQDEYWKLVREGVRDTEQRVQRLDRTARLEAKKSILNMKQEAVSRAFELAKDKIAELPERDYIGFLAREAAGAAITGQEEVIFCERDRAAVGAKAVRAANELLAARGMPATLTLADATREMAGGSSSSRATSRSTAPWIPCSTSPGESWPRAWPRCSLRAEAAPGS